MKDLQRAIKHFECVRDEAKVVLDSGFGTKPNESNIVFKNRKLYAELAISTLEKQIPKKPIKRNPICYQRTKGGREKYAYQHFCPLCDTKLKFTDHHCPCGQAIDWSDAE